MTTSSSPLKLLYAPLRYLKTLTVAGRKLVKGPKASASRTGSALNVSALNVIEKLYRGDYSSNGLLVKRSLTVDEYQKLLHQISQRPSLEEYFADKVW